MPLRVLLETIIKTVKTVLDNKFNDGNHKSEKDILSNSIVKINECGKKGTEFTKV